MNPRKLYTRLKTSRSASRLITPVARQAWRWSREIRRLLPLAAIPGLRRWSGRPTGYWRSMSDLLASTPDAGTSVEVYPAGAARRTPPLPLPGQRDLPHLNAAPVEWSPGRVYTLRGARLVGGYGGAVIARDGRLVGELSPDVWGSENHELFSRLRLPRATTLSDRVAMLATPEAPENYSHWLFDLLPRVLMLEQAGWPLADFDHFVVNVGGAPFCRETLRLLGVPVEKIRALDRDTAYAADEVVTASLRVGHWQHTLPLPLFRELATRLGAAGSGRTDLPRRLFLSRRNAPFRRLVNEAALDPLLARHGFTAFFPERYSLPDQIAAFRGAEAIVGPHGSAMCNFMFCAPTTRVLEIFPPQHADFSFWTAAAYAGVRYAAVMGEPLEAGETTRDLGNRFLDFSVDLNRCEEVLDALLAGATESSTVRPR